ncbi:porphobilinogen deaminase (hydroxymethylbilane synthase) [[Clostridium] ultunense Esp]|nr:porphobilinogen deaminase (hydroxymethylbilane synthase) [[Clostridium] ultunense Esp]
MKEIRVGSRRSPLALTQTKGVLKTLQAAHPEITFTLKEIVTKGDRIQDVRLSQVGGKGLFVKEIEEALLSGEIHFAVHSMKDVPAELPEGLAILSIPKRVTANDVLISKDGKKLDELPFGAKVGTGSLRRQAQLLNYRPDLTVLPLRGNIDTRLRKLREEGLDAIILAAAGLERMGWTGEVTEILPTEIMLPAVGQGALGIEGRWEGEATSLLQTIHDPITAVTTAAERAFLYRLEGGCQVPIAAFARWEEGEIHLQGLVASPDGKEIFRGERWGKEAERVGKMLAEELLEKGAGEVLKRFGG